LSRYFPPRTRRTGPGSALRAQPLLPDLGRVAAAWLARRLGTACRGGGSLLWRPRRCPARPPHLRGAQAAAAHPARGTRPDPRLLARDSSLCGTACVIVSHQYPTHSLPAGHARGL